MDFLKVFFEAQKRTKSSDLHLYVGHPPHLRAPDGNLYPIEGYDKLNKKDTNLIAEYLLTDTEYETLRKEFNYEFSGFLEGIARFRVNFFYDASGVSMVFRMIPDEIPSPEELGIPKQIMKLAYEKNGLILITGPNASGKSTTMAAILNEINAHRSANVITIEDPIEYIHQPKMSLFSQREVGKHIKDFKEAAKYLFRQDLDVIAIGELRDAESLALALDIVESGHLLISTVHSATPQAAISRIIGSFSGEEQGIIRTKLSSSVLGILSQQLVPLKTEAQRILATEVMLKNDSIKNAILTGEENRIGSVIEMSMRDGMHTFNDSIFNLFKEGKVSRENAVMYSTDPEGMIEKLGMVRTD